MHLVRFIRLLDRALTLLETAGVTVALLVMVVLSFAQVVLRNAHVESLPPVPWIPIVAQHLVLWVGMLGASLAAGDRRHISVEIISKTVTPQGRRVIEGLVDFAVIFVCALLSYVAWRYVDFLERPDARVIVKIGGVEIMAWWSYMILPVGFAAIAFRYFRLLIERILVDQPVEDPHESEMHMGDGPPPAEEPAP